MTLRKLFGLGPAVETSVYSPELSASARLIIAAGDNNIEEIKRLQKAGADINHRENVMLGSGKLRIGPDGVSQPENEANALMVALHNGAFEAALYLAREGADATWGRKDPTGMFHSEQKPLDFLLTDGMPNNDQVDLFTQEQRLRICDALVSNAKNPADLASESTLNNAIMWARSEVIHKLALIGVKIEDEHFVQAANPIHRPERAVKIMEALRPYMGGGGVNVTNRFKQNAGHVAAGAQNLEAFKWLEERGLDRNAEAVGVRTKTYAHAAAFHHQESEHTQVAFAQHLVDQGYELEGETAQRHADTPTNMAFDEGSNIAMGLVYLRAGTTLRPQHLVQALKVRHFKTSRNATENLLELVDMFSEREMLNPETATEAYNEMLQKISWDNNNASLYAPIAAVLTNKGFGLDALPLKGDEMRDAARLLLSAMEEVPEPARPVVQSDATLPPLSL